MAPLCLTVRQPYADAIVRPVGSKNIENRTRRTALRGPIGVHAGQQPHADASDLVRAMIRSGHIPTGAVVGTVHLVGCHIAGSHGCNDAGCYDNPWAQFPEDGRRIWHWELDHPVEFVTPIPCKGALGFWEPGPSVAHLISIAEPVEPNL